ncbi:MAG: FtsQ-type POTRA domain-containing protein [Aerococcus sp.]|nr:FtsQ-type POTRA domain-containing protein [Aerococcus sp.]
MVDWNREAKRYQRRQAQQTDNPDQPAKTGKAQRTSHTRRRPEPVKNVQNTSNSASARLHAQLDSLDAKERKARQRKVSQQQSTKQARRQRSAQSVANRTQPRAQQRKNSSQSPQVKQTRSTRHFSKAMAGYLLLFIATGIVFALWSSPLSRLSELAVDGNQLVSAKTVINDSGLHPDMSLLDTMTSAREVNDALQAKHSNIKNARLERNGRKVTVEVQEYQPVAKAYINGKLYPVFENQKVLAIDAKAYLKKLPLLESFANGQVERLAEALMKVPEDVRTKIKRVTNIEDKTHPDRIALEMSDGNIIIGGIDHFAQRLGYYPNVLKELHGETGLIDMEVGIYYEPLTPLNNPYATDEEKEAYQKQIPPTLPENNSNEESTETTSTVTADGANDDASANGAADSDTTQDQLTSSENTSQPAEASENLQ